MQVEVKIDSTYEEPKLIILTSKMTDELSMLVKRITEEVPQILS